ncbi:ion transport protein, putative [Trypanosoma cruzi marinkellei]|uniref:Ion transport protein, putative n=1 Tax=Trypanosoma cruzi marinkellei TaxID=85056 RepID=K2LZS0_TRYCR|nr:ion transport protein, putative [Trypanosoma cruzi marinkellei]
MDSASESSRTSPRRRKERGFLHLFRRKTRAFTLGPRLLGTRVKHLLRDELYFDVSLHSAPSVVTNEIASLELLAAYHRWLRGVQALLAVLVFILSLLPSAAVVEWTILAVSEAAVLIILRVYSIKAEYTGLTNVLYKDRRNILTSPFLLQMLLEIIVWNIQTPPLIFFWRPFFELLDYFIFVRLYAVAIYIHNAAYVYRFFCRAMTAMTALPLTTSFTVRTALVYRKAKIVSLAILFSWIALSCMYAKAEHVPLHDGFWYAFQAISTVGYGDITPATTAGRLVAFLAWVTSFVLIAYLVVIFHGSLTTDENEHNMYMLMRCQRLSHLVREDSARVIQTMWRFHRINSPLSAGSMRCAKALFYSWALTRNISRLRRERQEWRDATQRFRASRVSPSIGFLDQGHEEHLRHLLRAAQHAQKQADVDAFFRKCVECRERMPTREEVERAVMNNGWRGSFYSMDTVGVCGATTSHVDVTNLLKKVETLENTCSRLAALMESLAATAPTNPPSLAHSCS